MRKSLFLFLGCLFGAFGLLAASANEVQTETSEDVNFAVHNNVVTKNEVNLDVDDVDQDIILAQALRSKRRFCSSSFILFQADLSRCPIGLNDRNLLADDGVDFVTSFGGNDFNCRTLNKGGIEISPQNGQSFTLSVPPVPAPGPVPGGSFDHVKFLAYSLFERLPANNSGLKLCSTWVGSGEQLNVQNNPFNGFSPNPHQDPRLACFCFISINPALLTTFDWICTNEIIYALVERLMGAEALFGNYAAYTYMIPVARRYGNPIKDIHSFQICFDSNGTKVTWILDGKPVFRVTEVGHRLNETNAFVFKNGKRKALHDPTRFQVLDNGGADQTLVLDGIQTGLALLTFLDFFPAATSLKVTRQQRLTSGIYEGLVRLESNLIRPGTGDFYYNNPLLGGPANFVQNSLLDPATNQFLPIIPFSFRNFGQGAKLRLFEYTLSLEN